MAGPAVVVTGLSELSVAFEHAGRDIRDNWRADLKQIAEPVAHGAEQLARGEITNIGRKWPRMRIGVVRSLVYVAPRQKGTHGRGSKRRPNLADLLMDRAMEPALERNRARIEHQLEQVIDRAVVRFNRG